MHVGKEAPVEMVSPGAMGSTGHGETRRGWQSTCKEPGAPAVASTGWGTGELEAGRPVGKVDNTVEGNKHVRRLFG